MAANGISTLPTKEQRQKAKLDLAAADRAGITAVKIETSSDNDLTG